MKALNKAVLSFRLARWHYTPVIIVPVVLGTALAWHQGYAFRGLDFVLCLVGAWFAHLGANAANDCFDDISGVDRIAHETIPDNRGSTVCGSEVLTCGMMTRREGFIATATFFALAAACGIPLVIRIGWPIALLAIAGFFIGVFYCARPIAFGYIGRGLGEVGIFIAFGPLPVLGSFMVQAGAFSWDAVWASVPAGIFTVSVLYNHHFTHASADAAAGKISPVVALGFHRARRLTPVLLAATYTAIVIDVVFGIFPPFALAALVTAPFIFAAHARLGKATECAASLGLLGAVVKANVATGLLVTLALVFNL